MTSATLHRATELVPVMRERLADLETPVSAFAKLRALGGAFLLESVEGAERMGRFSFIGVAPRAVLSFGDGQVTIEQRGADPSVGSIAAPFFFAASSTGPCTAWIADSPSITPIRPVGQLKMKSGSNP